MRKISQVMITLSIVVAGLVSMPAAHAASSTITVTCEESSITIYGIPGDVFEFARGGSCNSNWELWNTFEYAVGPSGWLKYESNMNMVGGYLLNQPTWAWALYFSNSGTSSVTTSLMSSNADGDPLVTGTKIAEFDNDGVASPPTSVIPIIYGGTTPPRSPDSVRWTVVRQALPMPSSGACADIADQEYSWGTGLTGGWQKAWEPWAGNPQAGGGWACIRSLVNRGGQTWLIEP